MSIHGQEDQANQEIFKLSYNRNPLLRFGINGGDDSKPHLVADYLTEKDYSLKEQKDGKPQDNADKKLLNYSQGYGQRAIRDRWWRWDKGEEETGQNQGESNLRSLGDGPVAKEGGSKYKPYYPDEQQAKGQNGTVV